MTNCKMTNNVYVAPRLKTQDFDNYKAAGILPYRKRNGQIQWLVGFGEQKLNRINNAGRYHILAGKVEKFDKGFKSTAFREFNEESGVMFNKGLFKGLAKSKILWLPICKMGIYLLDVSSCSSKEQQIFENIERLYSDLTDRDIRVTPFKRVEWVTVNHLRKSSCHFVTKQLIKQRGKFFKRGRKSPSPKNDSYWQKHQWRAICCY